MALQIRPLSEELKTIAQTELNEVESRLAEEIETLREWILLQPHLKARTNDQFLLSFLRGSKHSLEKAKSKIDHFYTIRTMVPEVFKNLAGNEKLREIISAGAVLAPPMPPHIQGPQVCITRIDKTFDFKRLKLIDILQVRICATDLVLQNIDNCIINGFVEIFDLSKLTLGLYAQTDLAMMKKLTVFFEKGVPLRLKGLHIINCPKEGRDILLFVKSLLLDKYKKLFYVHKKIEDLHKFIPRETLPVEYGGTNGTFAEIAADNVRDFEAMAGYFKENDEYVVDERLRPHKKIDEKTLFGLEGSFRKLDID